MQKNLHLDISVLEKVFAIVPTVKYATTLKTRACRLSCCLVFINALAEEEALSLTKHPI